MLRLLALPAIVLSACAAGSGSSDSSSATPVAIVAGSPITAEDFRARYTNYILRSGLTDDQRLRLSILQQMIDDKLLVVDAVERGIEQDPEYRLRREIVRRKLLIELLTRRKVYAGIDVTHDELAEMHLRVNTRLKARHLYARTLEEAESLHARLLQGEAFEDLAREVFSDSTLAVSGGSVGEFDFDEMDPGFEDAAFGLVAGEISPPVRTAHGFSIIRLEDRFAHPLLTESDFARAIPRLKDYVLDRKRAAAREAFVRDVALSLDFVFDEESVSYLMRYAEGGADLTDDEAETDWLSRPLVRFLEDGEQTRWTIGRLGEEAEMAGERHRAQVRSRADLEEFVRGLVVRHVLVGWAEDEELYRDPSFQKALAYEVDAWIAGRAREFLGSSVTVPEDAIRSAHALYASGIPYDEARDGLPAALRRTAENEIVREYVSSLRKKYEVDVRRDRLAALALIESKTPEQN